MIKVDLNIDLKKIPLLSFEELRKYYNALFNVPTTSTRKEYYVWRITYKLQEMRFGGLDNKTRRMLENMDVKEISTQKMVSGIEYIRKYKGATYKVRVVNGGFEMDGEVYKSLGAVARVITGRKISGQVFFGV
ncbi:MAG: DUF2924 domain-containing protein [Alphaproteobacteria bacterium]|nr:DUF2924 domain-containing protein [Alphaproteobacteria bacterium]